MNIEQKKRILIAPLNWGLGHATRCIPIITALLENDFEPILASDGDALALLQLEFPTLKSFKLPSYNISYPKSGNLQWHLLKQLPHILKTMKAEHRFIQEIIKNENISGIISDNRLGVRSSTIPSIYITHQLKVLSGLTTFLATYFHHKIIHQFDECWIPDAPSQNLSGKLTSYNRLKIPIKYIGAISRLKYYSLPQKYDICVLLSGLEPQRTILENILLNEFQAYEGTICFIRGVVSDADEFKSKSSITFYNYLTSKNLNNVINQSELIIARSGYSTILDLAVLGKKALFIPTPKQTEQEYLAENLYQQKIAPFCKQAEFSIHKLTDVINYTGFHHPNEIINPNLFEVFWK